MIGEFTKLVLESNTFEFNGQYYKQLLGTAMGSHFAPGCANIFMDKLESSKLPTAPIQPIIWKRYIDNIFAVFTCSDEELTQFKLSTGSIKFTHYQIYYEHSR